ncbi:class I SAM-dependent methyltransferase [Geomobilimonas luticola]|uniref:Class I SAM-dependent methyltransferase n=1 Tax=Geomobilimonas luticola TaxID=1114878 RepID=A0ABS5SCE0_9BACT|nr:class I SAM-dependent methyltransferase [Geomobilimonas luticola]MBT0653029.1 class I SAM-dependent methyltransferase [Geomobilimonas luticola]
MNPDFVALLRCPKTGSELELTADEFFSNGMVRTGRLTAREGGAVYPVINGVPRFVGKEHYSDSFGYEWRKWPRVQFESENIGSPMEGHTTRMFRGITGLSGDEIKGKIVVEFGCGPGRFLDVVRSWGGIAVGIDMSLAVESAQENFKDDAMVLIIQGDVMNPPFARDAFDIGYTIGVLHHTPSPGKGIKALTDSVKSGGLICCCVYSKKSFYDYPSVRMFRMIHNGVAAGLGTGFATRMTLFYSYFAATILYYILRAVSMVPVLGSRVVDYVGKYLLVNLNIPDKRWRILDVFDAITPFYASTHTPEEVAGWFSAAGCTHIQKTHWGDTSFAAIKQ